MLFDKRLSTKGVCLVIRLNRLKHLPPAQYATEILQEANLPLLVAEFGKTKEKETYLASPIPTWRIDNSWARFAGKAKPLALFLGAFAKLFALIVLTGRPKLIVAHGMQEQCLTFLLTRIFNLPCVVHVHEIYSPKELDRFNRFFFNWGLKTLRKASLLIFPEKDRARVYQKHYRVRTPFEIVFNTPRLVSKITRQDLRTALDLPKNSILMGYMGGIGTHQAFEEAFVAMVEVPELHFLIWGWAEPKYQEQLEAIAVKYAVRSRIHFLGVAKKEKWENLAGCDFAYCIYVPDVLRLQHAATASNKLFEAMAVGIPVLTSDNPDFKSIVVTRDIGLTANPKSSTALARAMEVVSHSSELRTRWGENARHLHLTHYHFEKQFEQTKNTLLDHFSIKFNELKTKHSSALQLFI